MTDQWRSRPDEGAAPDPAGRADASSVTPIGGYVPELRQTSFDDLLEDGRRNRDRGMQTATYATDVAWVRACDAAIRMLAATGDEFDAEVVRSIVGPPVGSPNALGPRIGAAARRGLIVKVGYRQALRPERNAGPLAVWRGKDGEA